MTKKYRCEYCDNVFTSRRSLRLHMMITHSSEYFRPLREIGILWESELLLRCPECSRTFATVKYYTMHYLVKHRGGHDQNGPQH